MAAYQQKIASCFNKGIKIQSFKEGDLVLRKVTQNTRRRSDGILVPNWEGPYLIKVKVSRRGYKVMDLEGDPIGHTWNVDHLKRFYP